MRAAFAGILAIAMSLIVVTARAEQPPVSGPVKRPVTALQADEFWIQVASRQTLPDSIEVAEQYTAQFPRVAVLQSQNGWYAIVVDVVKDGVVQETLKRLKDARRIPDDSYATAGKSYLWIAWPEIDPYAPVTSGN